MQVVQAPHALPRLPGVTEMTSLMAALIDRPKEVKAFLKEYREVNAAYEELTKKYSSMKKLEALTAKAFEVLAKAEADQREAESTLATAMADARAVVDEADRDMAAERSAQSTTTEMLETRSAAMEKAEKEFAAESSKRQSDLDKGFAELASGNSGLQDRVNKFEARLASYDALRAQVNG